MAAIWAVVIMVFSKGEFLEGDVMWGAKDKADCETEVHLALDRSQETVDQSLQVVAKCFDASQLPVTYSVFGTRPPDTKL